jgi:hypothetical protein
MILTFKLNIIRVSLPVSCCVIALVMGHELFMALWVVLITFIMICFITAIPLPITLYAFQPVLSLYGVKLVKDEKSKSYGAETNFKYLYISCFLVVLASAIISKQIC